MIRTHITWEQRIPSSRVIERSEGGTRLYHLMVRRSYVRVRRTGEECDQLITVVNGACCDGVQLNTMNMRVKVKVDAFITLEPDAGRQASGRLNFCTVSPNICGPSLWILLHVSLLAPEVLWWLLDFWKICVPPAGTTRKP